MEKIKIINCWGVRRPRQPARPLNDASEWTCWIASLKSYNIFTIFCCVKTFWICCYRLSILVELCFTQRVLQHIYSKTNEMKPGFGPLVSSCYWAILEL